MTTIAVPRRRILRPRLSLPKLTLAAIRRLGDPSFNRLGIRGQPWGLGRAGAAAAWSPLDLTNLVLWINASQITGLNDADPVVTWEDLSGTGDDPTQAVAALRPTYRTNIQNGLPAVLWDGINDSLAVILATDLTQPITQFGVVRSGANVAIQGEVDGGDAGATRCVTFYQGASWQIFAGALLAIAPAVADTWYYFISIFDGVSSSMRLSGAAPVSGDAGVQDHGGYFIGSAFGGGNNWASYIAEYGVMDGLITADEIALLNPYMAAKWGV